MDDCLLWVGSDTPPDAVIDVVERRGWDLCTTDSVEGARVAAQSRPGPVLLGIVDTDFEELRAAVPGTVIAYCPPSTTPDGVSAATAAGVDVVLPQDASEWSVDTLDQRLCNAAPAGSDTQASIASVADDVPAVGPSGAVEDQPRSVMSPDTSEARLRRENSMVDSTQEMVFVLDENRVINDVSVRLADRLGSVPEDIVGRHVMEFVDLKTFNRAEQKLDDADGEVSLNICLNPIDGDPFQAAVRISLQEQDEHGERLAGVVEDRSIPAGTHEDLRREHQRLWTLFENLPDPVVDAEHVDGGPVVRAANDAFADVFGYERAAILGQPIDDVLASPAGEDAGSISPERINERVREGEVTGAKVRRETENGVRTFLFRGIPYAENGTVRAFGIYTDVTKIERRERHVNVLDRLLRHNLRNDLGIIIGRAENVLGRSDDDQIRAEATKLMEAARGLVELSDTAKRIRRIIESPDGERSAVPVGALFEDLVETANEEYPRACLDADSVADDLAVLATPHLRVAILELIENGVIHGSSSPMVELRVEQFDSVSDQWVDLLVVDDGPGIPKPERAAVTGDQDITQLEHGSGLGLWLVRWAVESIGGDLGFERRDGFTVVRLRLRRTRLPD